MNKKMRCWLLGLAVLTGLGLGSAVSATAPAATVAPVFRDAFPVDKATLVAQGRAPYFILDPGYQLVFKGTEAGKPVVLVITVLNEIKLVDGVVTRVVQEREAVDGELVEISRNYFAMDPATQDVYYFGEAVDIYEDGEVTKHDGSWESGRDGARFGLAIPGRPAVGNAYCQKMAPGVALDRAEVVGLRETVNAPAGRLRNCLKTRETNAIHPNEEPEYKWYAAGIGLVADGDLKLASHGMLPTFRDAFSVDKTRLVAQGRSPYFILDPGYQLVFKGEEDEKPVVLIITVLNETKLVDGVVTRVVEEYEMFDGELVEISRNYFALDPATKDVYYFGESVDWYHDGVVSGRGGSWESGIDGARFGLGIPGRPAVGNAYYQEIAPAVALDRAEVVGLRETVTTPAGRLRNCLKTKETTGMWPDGGDPEYKWYAAGIGLVSDGELKLSSHGMQPTFRDAFTVDKSKLVSEGRAPYFILEPGFQAVFEGREEGKPVALIITVLNETRRVDGVTARVVEERETVDGVLVEVSRNYFALDPATGDVYYFGEAVEMYEHGRIVNHEGEWESGRNGARFGLLIPGRPAVGDRFYQEVAPGVAMDRFEIVSVTEVVNAPVGRLRNCVKSRETMGLRPDGGEPEYKWYAAGIGLVSDGDLKLVRYTGGPTATARHEPAPARQPRNEPEDVPMTLDQVPPAVAATIRARSEGATIKELTREDEGGVPVYVTVIIKNGREREFKVAADGKFMYWE